MEPNLLEQGKALVMKGDVDGAINTLTEYLNDDFFNDEALFMLGNCFINKGKNGLAAVVTSAAVDARAARQKIFPEALMNLGACYKAEHRIDVAGRVWADALRQETVPRERSKILANLASLHINEGSPKQAIEICDAALREDPKNYGAMGNRGLACLELGRWREGWDGWQRTYDNGDRIKRRYPGVPDWDGSPGKTVIVWGDQGVGDEIYFASCLRDMAKVCKKVILDCHPRLDKLFQRSFPKFEVHGDRKTLTELNWLPDCGAEASTAFSDLPGFFRNEGEWDGEPYLEADSLPGVTTYNPKPRIGLSWTGGVKKTRTELRSLPIEMLRPILEVGGRQAQWFSLQYTPHAAREVCELEEKTGIRISHFPGWVECFDYDRTASFIGSMDLIITVCTTAHHIGGALGVPTWTLVPNRPSWRYQLTGETLPWYKSARLFRQREGEDWGPVVDRVAEALREWN